MPNLHLITGGAGFIGSHIVHRILTVGGRVRVVDNLATGKIERLKDVQSSVEFIHGDLADPFVCDDVIQDVDFVLHQAAVPSVERSVRDPVGTNRANVSATLNLLESSRKARVRRFVYAASSSAYGDTKVLPKHEDMSPYPLSPYALQKLTGEHYCRLYHKLYGLETISLRYFNVFGPLQDPSSEYSAVIPKFISRLLAGDRLMVYGDGEQSRDFTYIDNVVDANLLALTTAEGAGKVFNIGCGERLSLNQLIRTLGSIMGVSPAVDYLPPRAGDVRDSLAAIDLARKYLGFMPAISVTEGLRRTIEAFGNKACDQ